MKSVAEALERRCGREEAGAAVRLLSRGAEELARVFKEHVLQAVIDGAVRRALGKARGPRRQALTPWGCERCGPRRGDELRRNGHYLRRPLTCEGMITLRIPQLVCLGCGRGVAFSHPLLPRRQRLWLDLQQRLAVLYLEGASYRASRRILERSTRTKLGLMSLWRCLQAVAQSRHAPASRPPALYLGVDEVYHKVRGQPYWFLTVRAQAADGSKHYVGSILSADRSQQAWEQALNGLGVSRYNPPFAVLSDGDRAIEEALRTCLPGVRLFRCTWHIKHNAAEWVRERFPRTEDQGTRRGLAAAVDVIVDAPTIPQRGASLAELETAHPWLTRLLRQALDRVPPKDAEHPVRTNNLMERGFRELRRRTRPMDGFKSTLGASNFHTLWMLKENARSNRRDYLPELIP